jgi:hypothetical protein
VIFGWLARVLVGLALLALVVFNAISMVAGRVGTQDDAASAAAAAATAYKSQGSLAAAVTAADGALGSHSEVVVPGSVVVLPNGDVKLSVRRHVDTVLVGDIPWLKHFTEITQSGVGAPDVLS